MRNLRPQIAALAFLIFLLSPATRGQSPPPPVAPNAKTTHPPLIDVLVQSPADTQTELQIICLFESDPQTPLEGALKEIDERLHGLLNQTRASGSFKGHLGETFLIKPPNGTIPAKKLLLVGLGYSGTFKPKRMEQIAKVVFSQSNLLMVVHPYFAPNILDGGVTKYSTGDVARHFAIGFRNAIIGNALGQAMAKTTGSPIPVWPISVSQLTYLAGPAHADDTKKGIEKGLR